MKKTIPIQHNPIQRFKQHTGHINVFQIVFPYENIKYLPTFLECVHSSQRSVRH